MANILGQFLRFLHYQLIYMIDSEMETIINTKAFDLSLLA